jgi:hypothetical protein
MDRGLIGILLICFVGSSVVVALFLGERTPSPVTILKVEHPSRFDPGVPHRFALNVLARRDVGDLTVKYSLLYRVSADRSEELYGVEGVNESVLEDEDPRTFLIESSGTDQMRESLPGDVEFQTIKTQLPFSYRDKDEIKQVDLDLRFYDFTEMMQWASVSASPTIFMSTTAFAFVSIPEGNISVFKGVSDYYTNRPDSVSDIEFGKGDESTQYLNPKIRETTGEYLHVNDAPPFGTVSFGALEKGQRAQLSFTTRDMTLPAIQVVRFWVNGEFLEDETRFNLLGGPL